MIRRHFRVKSLIADVGGYLGYFLRAGISAAWPTGSGHFPPAFAARASVRWRTRSSMAPPAGAVLGRRQVSAAAGAAAGRAAPRLAEDPVGHPLRVEHEPPGPFQSEPPDPARRQFLDTGNLFDGPADGAIDAPAAAWPAGGPGPVPAAACRGPAAQVAGEPDSHSTAGSSSSPFQPSPGMPSTRAAGTISPQLGHGACVGVRPN